jgi:hypothetical protein
MACERTNNLGKENNCKCTFTHCDKWGRCCACVLKDYFIKNIGIPLKESH